MQVAVDQGWLVQNVVNGASWKPLAYGRGLAGADVRMRLDEGRAAVSWFRGNLADAAPDGGLPSAADVFALAFDHSPIAMSLSRITSAPHASEGRRSFAVNQATADMLGRPISELLEAEDQGQFTHPDDRASDAAHLADLVGGTETNAQWEKRYLHADGHIVWGRVSLSLLRHSDGSPWFAVAHIEDVTARRELERVLREQADTDELTGLYNRRAFRQAGQEELERVKRDHGKSALVMIDVDFLKQINDDHGHHSGDQALKAVAAAIRERIRASDVAARIGGDEFVVLLAQTIPETATAVAESIRTSIGQAIVTVRGGTVPVTASIGVMTLDRDTVDLDCALDEADRRMLTAKRDTHYLSGPRGRAIAPSAL